MMRSPAAVELPGQLPHDRSNNSSSESVDNFAHLNEFDSKSPYADSGNYPHIHYKTKIHPLRFKARQWLLPYIRAETEILAKLQQQLRSPVLDYYFAWTANLASHTFYVLMLPLPLWFGYGKITRDLVFLLGYGIFFTGYVKDFCCLPRPRSPPLHRITMSGYTAKEYGFPSSHSANATAVSILMMMQIWDHSGSFVNNWTLVVSMIGLFSYYFSLIVGRLYCGMHGFADIAVGSLIGATLYFIRSKTWEWYDRLVLNGPFLGILIVIGVNYSLIYFHVSPVDDCPCYDDSVAFIGVIMGLEVSQWLFCRSLLRADLTNSLDLDIPYTFKEIGIVKSIIRVIVGVILVAIWKEISKPLLLKGFQPIYNLVEHDADAPTFNRIRSDTLGKREKVSDVKGLVKDMSKSRARDSVGPESTIDLTEFEDIHEHPTYFEALDKLQHENVVFTCGVFKQRYDITVIVRLIVYAGIPFVAVLVFPVAAKLLRLV